MMSIVKTSWKTLAEACQKAGFAVHAYCLMKNHFHLVVQTPQGNLVAGMRWLSAYSLRLNHRRKLSGHVLSGRYKALVVEGDRAKASHGRQEEFQQPASPTEKDK